MPNCYKCRLLINEKDEEIQCDSCRASFHYHKNDDKNCSGLSTTEFRTITLQKKSMMFFCDECRMAFKSAPALLRSIEQLSKRVSDLESEIIQLKKGNNEGNAEVILEELNERNSRACNLMLYNVKESNASQISERIEADKAKVTEVMNIMQLQINEEDIIRVSRVGFKKGPKDRPLKIVFNMQDKVKNVLRQGHLLKDTIYGISPDRTKMQVEHFKSIKSELRSRMDNGEKDIELKFIHGVPKIVPKRITRKN